MTKKCSVCGRVMAKHECDNPMCDECAGITLKHVEETYVVKLVDTSQAKASSWADVLNFIKYWDVESVDVLQNDQVVYRIKVQPEV